MKTNDARTLSPSAQAALRERAVHAVLELQPPINTVARTLGVCRQSVSQWVNRVRQQGKDSVAERRRGAPLGPPLLTAQQTQELLQVIEHHEPNDFDIPGV
jgi:transposase-like protein